MNIVGILGAAVRFLCPGCILPGVVSAGFPGRCGIFSKPWEKMVMFLTAPKRRDSAVLSGLSDDTAVHSHHSRQ